MKKYWYTRVIKNNNLLDQFLSKIIFICNYIYLRYINIEEFELINIVINREIKFEVFIKKEIIWTNLLISDLYF